MHAIPRRTLIAPIVVYVAAALSSSAGLEAQTVVPVHQEPRHRLVLDRPPVRVLDVRIMPGDTTLFHTHDSALLYVAISVSTTVGQSLGGEWPANNPAGGGRRQPGGVTSNVDYPRQPRTHRVTNVGDGLFRLIAVANYGEGSPIDRPKDDIPGALEIDDPYFRAWRLTLQPGQASPWFRSSQPLVGVQVSSGEIEVQRRSGEPSALTASGDWFFGDPGAEYRIRGAGEHALELVLVQAR